MAQTIYQSGYDHHKIERGWVRWLDGHQLVIWFTVAVIIRVGLITQPVWYDESFTYWLAGLSLPNLIQATAGDVHPPAYYILAWFSVRLFGLSFWAIRLPALIFGLLSLVLFGLVLDNMILPRPVKNLAIILAISSPFLIYYSVEARMYSLLLFCILGAALGIWRKNFLTFGLALGLGFLSHNIMIIYAPILAGLWLWRNRWPGLLMAGAIAGAVYVIWLPFAIYQIKAVKAAFWVQPLTIGRVIASIYETVAEVATNADTLIFSAIFILSILLVGTWQASKERAWAVLALAWGPLAITIIFSWTYRPVLSSPARILIGATPFLLILLGWGVFKLYSDIGGVSIPLAAIIVFLVMISNLYVYPVRGAFNRFYGQLPIEPTNICYHLAPASIVLVNAYIPCNHYIWPQSNNLEQSLSDKTKSAMGMQQTRFEDLPTGQVWLFHSDGPFNTEKEYLERARILSAYPNTEYQIYNQFDILSSTAWQIERR